MRRLEVVGRSIPVTYPEPFRWYGAVSLSQDKSDRNHDIVCSLPTSSPAEALYQGRALRQLIIAQEPF